MNAYQRLKAMTEGKEVDRPGASVWKHFYLDDHNGYSNVRAHIAFQERNNWDLLKIMSNGVYMQEQYGAEIIWSRSITEFPVTRRRAVLSPRGFRSIKAVDVTTGAIAREVEVARRLADKYHGQVPVLANVFTPSTYAQELYNGFQNPYMFRELMEYYWEDLEEGLKVLTDVTYRLVEQYVKAGVDGIFYSSQHMYGKVLTPELYERLIPSDLQAAQPALEGCWFNMLHVHGDSQLFFQEIAQRYPFQAFNWEDILSGQSLGEIHRLIPDKILVGGLCRHNDFRVGDREAQLQHTLKRVKEAAAQVPANKLIVAGGCAQDTDIPHYRFDTLREAMEILYGPYDC